MPWSVYTGSFFGVKMMLMIPDIIIVLLRNVYTSYILSTRSSKWLFFSLCVAIKCAYCMENNIFKIVTFSPTFQLSQSYKYVIETTCLT